MEHNTQKSSTRRKLSAACCILLVSACRFSSTPTEELGADASVVSDSDAPEGTEPARNVTMQTTGEAAAKSGIGAAGSGATAAVGVPAQSATAAGSAPQSAGVNASTSANAGASAPVAAGSAAISAHAPPPAAATTPAAGGGAVAAADLDAGAPNPPVPQGGADAGDRTRSDAECSADLANCLLKNPLNYAECLRANADNGCPEPDAGAGTGTTSPVTGEDGKPLSMACQAELANCIARNPTPANAEECTATARKCK